MTSPPERKRIKWDFRPTVTGHVTKCGCVEIVFISIYLGARKWKWIINVCAIVTHSVCSHSTVNLVFTYLVALSREQLATPVHTVCYTRHHITLSAMMTSSNGNIFRVNGHLCGEFTGPRLLPRTKASDAELWCYLWSASEQTLE